MPHANGFHLSLWKTGAILMLAGAGLTAGLAVRVFGRPDLSNAFWIAGTVPALATLLVEILRSLRTGLIGLDFIAALSMSAALVFGETLAAAVIAVMYSGGTVLESYAEGQARREMHDLLSRVPRTATRHGPAGLEEVPLDDIEAGDRLLIRQGDVVPVDGTVASDIGFVDTAALTGESLPVRLVQGASVMSGVTNAGHAFDLTALRPAQQSTYAGIVRLVEKAQSSRAPMARLADRWSLGFLLVTMVMALAAWWLSGDPARAVAVLVVATPCPLILAVPVALVAGLSRAAHYGILIKGAGPLETMARIRVLILDKTGTLTFGTPSILAIEPCGEITAPDVLRRAAALDQASSHPVAKAIVAAALDKGLTLPIPSDVNEVPGEGMTGQVDGYSVTVGSETFVASQIDGLQQNVPVPVAGALTVAVAWDDRMAGRLVMADTLRDDVRAMLDDLRRAGIARILLATGDRAEVAARVASGLGFDGIEAGLTPDQKVKLVQAERVHGPVMMVGDGVNDAPALAASDVGVAMGARGAAASAEAADVVLLVDRINRLVIGIEIARGTRRIAVQSVVAGLSLSVSGMIAAVLGHLTPVQGAMFQEAIDVAVILNALRTLRITPHGISLSRREAGGCAKEALDPQCNLPD